MAKVRKNIVSSSVANKVTYSGTNPKTHIVIHETANTNKGANADAHGRLQANGNSRQASWHYTVDDKEIVQSFSDNAQCWHAGNANYNRKSIGVEICVNSDGNYKKAVDNAAELVKSLMSKYNIPATNVIQHHTSSGKNCPAFMRSGSRGITWGDFNALLLGKSIGKVTNKPKTSKPSTPKVKASTTSRSNITVDGKWGKSTTRALQKALNTPVDGIISKQPRNSVSQSLYGGTVQFGSGSSNVIVALQRKVGANADGKLGPATVRALQKYLGTVQDGVLSRPSLVVKEMQRRLNAGKF